jgi:mono/diheme cytochrome c family protein
VFGTRFAFVRRMAGFVVLGVVLAGVPVSSALAHPAPPGASGPAANRQDPGGHHDDHEHPPVPDAYAKADLPRGAWTDPAMLARGKEIFAAKCAVCHGDNGNGKGVAAASLAVKPPDLTDARMVAEMAGNYWVWRVSEGALSEPFKSKGSAMPAWKEELSLRDRWAVIAYAHTLSGHRGPHDASEHAELRPRPKFAVGEGTVIAVRRDRQQIVVEHGVIKDFMEAMTMGYRIALSIIDRVKPGDRVRFTIDTDARAITGIEKLGE